MAQSSDSGLATTAIRIGLAGVSACCGAAFTNPVDVVKIRMQVDGEAAKREGRPKRYTGMTSGMRTIFAEEGMRGLYKGVGASLCREMSYSGIRFGAYETFKELFGAKDPKNTPLWKKLASGACSGAFGSAIANPCDLVKIRMQSDIAGTRYRNVFAAWGDIFRAEGVRGLYVGVAQTVQRAFVLGGCQAPAYDHTKHTIKNLKMMEEGVALHLVSSFVAGIVAVTVTAPIDLIKTRVMSGKSAGEGGKPMYAGTVDCFMKTVRAEGVLGLWAGWIPGWMRLGPHTIVTFLVFEQLRLLAGMRAI
eukprot:TRINITY_DN13800_c0_g1_i1.p1 TRINITY_DN13800_c0_g1~~TRINITY_DN13800_c0_g1_i1.p1  ORF type:complete len:343 (+),score=110.98 TRINITY_DN13800_c0_g1_i1:115-1029(+)